MLLHRGFEYTSFPAVELGHVFCVLLEAIVPKVVKHGHRDGLRGGGGLEISGSGVEYDGIDDRRRTAHEPQTKS